MCDAPLCSPILSGHINRFALSGSQEAARALASSADGRITLLILGLPVVHCTLSAAFLGSLPPILTIGPQGVFSHMSIPYTPREVTGERTQERAASSARASESRSQSGDQADPAGVPGNRSVCQTRTRERGVPAHQRPTARDRLAVWTLRMSGCQPVHARRPLSPGTGNGLGSSQRSVRPHAGVSTVSA
jgi:hypothetical protein